MAINMILVGIGLGLTISPIGTAVINEADESQRGVASALVIIFMFVMIGGVAGVLIPGTMVLTRAARRRLGGLPTKSRATE